MPCILIGAHLIQTFSWRESQKTCKWCNLQTPRMPLKSEIMYLTELDLADPNQQCPPNFRLYTKPKRRCGKSTDGNGCDSAKFTTNDLQYNKVCGRVVGYELGGLSKEARRWNSRNQGSSQLTVWQWLTRAHRGKLTSRPRIKKQTKQEDTKILATIQNFRRRQERYRPNQTQPTFQGPSSTTMWVWLSL